MKPGLFRDYVEYYKLLTKEGIVIYYNFVYAVHPAFGGRDSAIGIATQYALQGPRFKPLWGRDIP